MKKLMYLFVTAIMFAFTACGGGESTEKAAEETVEVAACCCGDEACAGECHAEATEKVGCQVEGGTCLADHSCCAANEAAACCCGDEACDGSCHGDEAAAEEAHDHSGHDH